MRREVMPPRRPSSSFGLIAVSTLAMVFAVSSSLLLFSAHNHRARSRCPYARPATAPVVLPHRHRVPAAPIAAPDRELCREPVYYSTGDGRTELRYEQCAARPFAGPIPVRDE